jgi:hypothetical protein
MRLGFLLSIFPALYNAVTVDAAVVKLDSRQSGSGSVLTPDVVQLMQETLDANGIPGFALAIVYEDEDKATEYGTWGFKYEDGTKMTKDVRWLNSLRLLWWMY